MNRHLIFSMAYLALNLEHWLSSYPLYVKQGEERSFSSTDTVCIV